MQGFTQFVTWSKVADVFNHLSFESVLDSMDGLAASSSQDVKDSLRKMTYDYFDKYPPTYQDTWDTADLALNNITGIPDSFWPQVADGGGDSEDLAVLTDTIYTLMSCISNGLFEAFKIDISKDVADEDPNSSSDGANWENEVQFRTWDRYMLIVSTRTAYPLNVIILLTLR